MRSLRLALVASLLVNLFLAGALVGGAAWLHGGRRMIAAGAMRIPGAELPAAERHAFRATLRAARREVRPVQIAGRAARAEAARLLRQPVVDQPALLAALARARAADLTVRAAVEQRGAAFAATLPAADRATLADAMVRDRRDGKRAPAR